MSTTARAAELQAALTAVRGRISAAVVVNSAPLPLLVAVSKYKPAADIAAAYAAGQRDFGENYVQELVDKASVVRGYAPLLSSTAPSLIRAAASRHTMALYRPSAVEQGQDRRRYVCVTPNCVSARTCCSHLNPVAISNLHTLHTLTSAKVATALDKARDDTAAPLRVLLQVNTSGEAAKSGLQPLRPADLATADAELITLAQHVITSCPRLRLTGLMTIGALDNSRAAASGDENADFEVLRETRVILEEVLAREFSRDPWGEANTLTLSMGMSADYEAAIRAGSGIVRVGSSIFGERLKKGEAA